MTKIKQIEFDFFVTYFPVYTFPKRTYNETSRYYDILMQGKCGIPYLYKQMAKQRRLHLKLKMTMVTSLIQEEKYCNL